MSQLGKWSKYVSQVSESNELVGLGNESSDCVDESLSQMNESRNLVKWASQSELVNKVSKLVSKVN